MSSTSISQARHPRPHRYICSGQPALPSGNAEGPRQWVLPDSQQLDRHGPGARWGKRRSRHRSFSGHPVWQQGSAVGYPARHWPKVCVGERVEASFFPADLLSKLYSITNVESRTALEVSATGISAGPFTAIDNQYWDFQLATGFQPTTAINTPAPTTTTPVAPLSPQIPQVRGRPGDSTTVTLFATGNICGNPQCGKSFICAADYNRVVQPMGYPGVR